jgi:hypothetical protein
VPTKDTFDADLGALVAIAAVWKLLFVGLFLWSSRPKGEMHEKTGFDATVEDGEGQVATNPMDGAAAEKAEELVAADEDKPLADGLGSAVKEGEHVLTVRNAGYTVHHKQQGDIPILQVRGVIESPCLPLASECQRC